MTKWHKESHKVLSGLKKGAKRKKQRRNRRRQKRTRENICQRSIFPSSFNYCNYLVTWVYWKLRGQELNQTIDILSMRK